MRFKITDLHDINALPWLKPETIDILWDRPWKNKHPHHGPLVRKWRYLQRGHYLLLRCDDVNSSVDCEYVNHYCRFSWQCSRIERDDISKASNGKAEYKIDTMSYYRRIPVVSEIFLWPYTCLEAQKREFSLLVYLRYRHRDLAPGVVVYIVISYTTRTSLV